MEMSQEKQKREIRFPITVRQAQKLAGNPNVFLRPLGDALQVLPGEAEEYRRRVQAKLARLAQIDPSFLIYKEGSKPEIGANPPDADTQSQSTIENREAGEARPKGTDEVVPQSEAPSEESACHGGDGNSGECDAPAKTDSQFCSEAQSQADGSKRSGGNEPGIGVPLGPKGSGRDAEMSDRGSETGIDPTSEGDDISGKPPSSDRQLVPSPSTALGEGDRPGEKGTNFSDNQPRDAGFQEPGDSRPVEVSDAPEESGEGDRAGENTSKEAIENGIGEIAPRKGNQPGDDRPAHQKKWGKKLGKAGSGKLSASANPSYGGMTAALSRIGVDGRLLNLCRLRLGALVGDSSHDYGPRRDYAEFCVRLKTYRNPAPARLEEKGRPVVLVMADVSSSCAGFSQQSVAVAKAASKLGVPGADVLVLSHSNGYPCELEHNSKPIPVEAIGPLSENEYLFDNAPWYEALLKKFQIQAVVALGDWDGFADYLFLMQQPLIDRFIWLDNAYCSSRGTVEDHTKWAIERIKNYVDVGSIVCNLSLVRPKLVYRDGCKNAVDFIENIKIK